VVLDEVHRFKSRKLYDVMKYAGAAREQPLLVSITTAGTDRHSLCYQLHRRALEILDGTVTEDLDFLGVVYAADPEKDDLGDPATWKKANPSLGVIISLEDFRKEYEQARRIPGQLNNFKRLRLNIWVESATKWLPFDLWDAGCDPVPLEELAGLACHAALDLSSVKDLTSLSLAFPMGDHVRVWNHCWMPEETVARRSETDLVDYRGWIEDGWMTATPGNATDYAAIRSRLKALVGAGHKIVNVGLDPWNAQSLANDLMDDEFEVLEIRQGYPTLTGPSKDLERLLLAGHLRHDGNPVLRWAVGNCATETDAQGNIKPSKKRSTERIDPVVTTVMAIGLCSAEAPRPKARITLLPNDE
jgi:phage terminase large subunit-like protein